MSPENTARNLIPERCAYRNVKGRQCLVETNDPTVMLNHLADRDHVFVEKDLKPEYKPIFYHCGYRRPKQHDQTTFETCAFVTTDPEKMRVHAVELDRAHGHSMHAMKQYNQITSKPTPTNPDTEALDRLIHGLDHLQDTKFPSTRSMYLETRDKLYRLLADTQEAANPQFKQGVTAEVAYLTTRLEALILLRKTEDGPTNRRGYFAHNTDKD